MGISWLGSRTVAVGWLCAVACGSGPTPSPQAPAAGSDAGAGAMPSAVAPSPAAPAASAGGAPETPGAGSSPAEQQHWQTVQALAAAVDAHDPKRIAAQYAPDAELTVIPGAGVLRGRDKIAADQGPFFQAFPDYRYAIRRAWVTPEVAVVEAVGTGTNTGDFLGLKATGRRAGQTSLAIYWFSPEGLVAREHLYEDGATMLAQLGGQMPASTVPAMPEKPEVHFADGGEPGRYAVAVGRDYIDAAGHKDVAKMLSLLADDVEFQVVMSPLPEKGKAQARQAFEKFTATFPDARWDVTNAWGVGDYAIFEYAIQGTQDGPIGPMPPTHRKVDWHWARVLEVHGGKITHGWAYANSIELMGELGALERAGAAPAPAPAPSAHPTPKAPPKH